MGSYSNPNVVFKNIFFDGRGETSAFVFLVFGCFLAFISLWPVLARKAHEEHQSLNMLLGAALFAWIFIAPLIFYLLALVLHLGVKIFGFKINGLFIRLSLFWGFLAAAPIMLVYGLVGGFLGEGFVLDCTGILWCLVISRFIFVGLSVTKQVER
tara:strand:+ start:48 stop:512 length:465 start_codon:yes stop_codon:yes gene_type:complete